MIFSKEHIKWMKGNSKQNKKIFLYLCVLLCFESNRSCHIDGDSIWMHFYFISNSCRAKAQRRAQGILYWQLPFFLSRNVQVNVMKKVMKWIHLSFSIHFFSSYICFFIFFNESSLDSNWILSKTWMYSDNKNIHVFWSISKDSVN